MMPAETKTCQNCLATRDLAKPDKTSFTLEPDDLAFLEKVRAPKPTFCPDCRKQRRFAWRNERTLHKRTCDSCKKSIIGLYPAATPFPVYCHACWFSDSWDPLSFGRAYDFSKPFFEQFRELQRVVPRLAIFNTQSTNSEYTNQSYHNKNAYLSFALRDSEDVAYIGRAVEVKNFLDVTYTHHSEGLYGCLDTDKSYRGQFLRESEGCIDSAFLLDSRNCQNCFGGVNLRSASHVFFGEKLPKEEYARRRKEADLGSYRRHEEYRRRFRELAATSIHRAAKLVNCVRCVGDHLANAKDCVNVFDGFELEHVRHSSWVFTSREVSDAYGMGGSEFIYEAIGVEDVNNLKFCTVTDATNHAEYTDLCFSSSYLFGCIGMRSKQHVILNTQYTKGEYEALREKIMAHMQSAPYRDRAGRVYAYGEFFPAELSPFAYNETIAQESFPLTRTEAEQQGYAWREPEEKHPPITKRPEDLPDHIRDVGDDILSEVIACAHGGTCNDQCTAAFKVIPQELQFYRAMQVPLPRLCPNCRHYERLRERNPLTLAERPCACGGSQSAKRESQSVVYANTAAHAHGNSPCGNRMRTTYPPERKEIVYCESCYQSEVA